MVRTRRWQRAVADVLAVAGLTLTGLTLGCQVPTTDKVSMSLTQTPPTVQAAYNEDHPGTVIRSVSRESRGEDHYYTVKYQDGDGAKHDVVYNGAGNEIDKH